MKSSKDLLKTKDVKVLQLFLSVNFYRLRSLFYSRQKKSEKSVLFFAAFFPENAGYHWRVKKWAEILESKGYSVEICCACTKDEFYELLKNNRHKFILKFLKNRVRQVIYSRKFETVIVRRELLLFNDYGNLFLEKILLRFHPNAILDFDDDLAASKNQPKRITNFAAKILQENGNKFNDTLRLYKRFIVASDYLKSKVLTENKRLTEKNILVIPTCVDYDKYPPKDYSKVKDELVFGWIGGNHNYPQLINLFPVLNRLSEKYSFKLLVIGGEEIQHSVEFKLDFVSWSLQTEVEHLYKIDVGLMPLIETKQTKGKGGFKLIQYMGLGIVSVASPITINKVIINNRIDGFLALNNNEWYKILNEILNKDVNLNEMGRAARFNISNNFNFKSHKKQYLDFIC